ncbi:hypothetical protein Tco_0445808 [Tanacetum coccineum]
MGQAAAGHTKLWRCWPRQSSAWSASRMQQVSSLEKTHRMSGTGGGGGGCLGACTGAGSAWPPSSTIDTSLALAGAPAAN